MVRNQLKSYHAVKKPVDEIYLPAFLFGSIDIILFIGSAVCLVLFFLFQNNLILMIYLLICLLYAAGVTCVRNFFKYEYKNTR